VRPQLNRLFVLAALVAVLPLIAVSERVRHGSGRRVANRCLRRATRVCGVTVEVAGRAALEPDRPYVLAPTHSSPFDIPALLLACPDVRFFAAAELFRIPLLAGAMRALDTLPIERRDPTLARRQLTEFGASDHGVGPDPIVIFPEGAIAPAGTRLPFKTGAFALAIQSGASVVPVSIRGSGTVLPPHGRLAVRPGTVTVEFLAPIPTDGLTNDDRGSLRDQVYRLVTTDAGN
jgi:1-acyl-sn-glycerol-3-phosphate acyltransferase